MPRVFRPGWQHADLAAHFGHRRAMCRIARLLLYRARALAAGGRGPSTMTDFVQQKFDADCAVASLAMLLGVAYERVAQHCQGNMIVRFGLPDFRAVQIAAMFEVELVELDASRIDWSRPAVLTVPSLNAAADTESTGMHAVYWDGTRVWDPNHGRPGKRTWTNQAARRSAIDGMQARPR